MMAVAAQLLEMKSLTLLGSTGSIGTNTLDVVRQNRPLYGVYGLVAGHNTDAILQQIIEFRPKVAVLATSRGMDRVAAELPNCGLPRPNWPELSFGPAAHGRRSHGPRGGYSDFGDRRRGGAGSHLRGGAPGKRVGLANKEVLVSGGRLVMDAVRESGAELLPIDSEHNGVHQCLRAGNRDQVSRLILTASGGPFRNTPKEALASVTPAQALNHPTWRMGKRITIDCATLMNKGFEVIEACWLFGFAPSQVDVVIHPQSTVHAMIEYSDGSVLAQISATDMRMPIQYALTWPERWQAPVPKIDWTEARQWEFLPPDFDKFPLLKLAYQCQEAGGSATCTLNAADEIAVEAFLKGELAFPGIADVVEETLCRMPDRQPRTVGDILEIDEESRSLARELVAHTGGGRRAPGSGKGIADMVFFQSAILVPGPDRRDDPDPRAGTFLGGALLRCPRGGLQLRFRAAPVRLPPGRDRLPLLADSFRRLREDGRRAARRRKRQRSARFSGQAALAAPDHRIRRSVHECGAGRGAAHRPLHGQVPKGGGRRQRGGDRQRGAQYAGGQGRHSGRRPIVRLEGRRNPTWEDIILKEVDSASRPMHVTIERGGRDFDATVTPVIDDRSGLGMAGWSEKGEVQVAVTSPNMPAQKAGLQKGDLILNAGGHPIHAVARFHEIIRGSDGKPVPIEFQRAGQLRAG